MVPGTGLMADCGPARSKSGCCYLREYGTMRLRDVLETRYRMPAMATRVEPRGSTIQIVEKTVTRSLEDGGRGLFCQPNEVPKPGTLFTNTVIRTYARILQRRRERQARSVAKITSAAGLRRQVSSRRRAIKFCLTQDVMAVSRSSPHRGVLSADDMARLAADDRGGR